MKSPFYKWGTRGPNNCLFVIPKLKQQFGFTNPKMLYSQNSASFLYQTGPILGHIARVKVIRQLRYTRNKTAINTHVQFAMLISAYSQSQWPRGLRRWSLAARLLRLWVRIPPGAWIFVCCECCVLSGRGLCDGLIIRSEESYRLWRVVVCDQETS